MPDDFVKEFKSDLDDTLRALGNRPSCETIKFHWISSEPLVYVHVYRKRTTICKLQCFNITMSTITMDNQLLPPPPPVVTSVDFRPFLYDNLGLKRISVCSHEFLSAYNGTTASIDCQEYTEIICALPRRKGCGLLGCFGY